MKESLSTTLVIVCLVFMLSTPKVHAAFSDVPKNYRYYEAISWAQNSGIVKGYSDGTFRPDASVNRAEFLKILLEADAMQHDTECDDQFFPDVFDRDWFSPYTRYAKCKGIITGYPDGTFRPANQITMAEAAKIIANLDSNEPLVIPKDDRWWGVYIRYIHMRNAYPPSAGSHYGEPITRSEMVYMMYALQNPGTDPTDPFVGATLYVDLDTAGSAYVREKRDSDPQKAALMKKIADQPVTRWFGVGETVSEVRKWIDTVTNAKALPIFVLYNIPDRDLGQDSAGGAKNVQAYQQWITDIADSISDRKAVVILEPDAVPDIDGMNSEQQRAERLHLLSSAIGTLKSNQHTAVYLDAGNAEWLSVERMIPLLKAAGVERADGISVNVSNFMTDADSIAYGERISDAFGGKLHIIIDSSRNGNGPHPDGMWRNPPGRALGLPPSAKPVPGHPRVYRLWVKSPEESDGEGETDEEGIQGPPAGELDIEYALELARNAKW